MDEIQSLDKKLNKKGLKRAENQGCDFIEAVAKQGKFIPESVRQQVVQYLRNNEIIDATEWKTGIPESPEEYLKSIENPTVGNVPADFPLKLATASALNISIKVIKIQGVEKLIPENRESERRPKRFKLGMLGTNQYYTTEVLTSPRLTGDTRSPLPPLSARFMTTAGNPGHGDGVQSTEEPQPASQASSSSAACNMTTVTIPGHGDGVESTKESRPVSHAPSSSAACDMTTAGIPGHGDGVQSTKESQPVSQAPSSSAARHTATGNGSIQKDNGEIISKKTENSQEIMKEKVKRWMIKTTKKGKDVSSSSRFFEAATLVLKYASTLVFLLAVLVGSIVTKSTLLVLGNAYTQNYTKGNAPIACPYIDNDGTSNYYYTKYMVMLILMCCLCFPELLALTYSAFRVCKKKKDDRKILWSICLKGAITEILHAIGIVFLTLMVIPRIDATLATAMLSIVTIGPAVSNAVDKFNSGNNSNQEYTGIAHFFLSVFAVILVLVAFGLVSWQIFEHAGEKKLSTMMAAIFSLIFISSRYWENFWPRGPTPSNQVHPSPTEAGRNPPASPVRGEGDQNLENRGKMDKHRFEMTVVYSIVRIAIIVVFCFLIHFAVEGNQSVVEIDNISSYKEVRFTEVAVAEECASLMTAFWMAGLTNALASFGTYFFGLIACQTEVQIWAFTVPLILATPTMGALTASYTIAGDGKSLTEFFALTLKSTHIDDYIGWMTWYDEPYQVIIVVIVGLLFRTFVFVCITNYPCKQESYPMERSEILFVKPIYAGPLISEELLLNKRRDMETAIGSKGERYRDFTPQLFLCATMWQEKKHEMMQIMKSIFKLDKKVKKSKDTTRNERNGNKEEETEKCHFEFEVHVFFDEAFSSPKKNDTQPKNGDNNNTNHQKHEGSSSKNGEEGSKFNENNGNSPEYGDDGNWQINDYVKQLLEVIPEAAEPDNITHEFFKTPYGKRIKIVLPHGNQLLIHLKDSTKIRKKKRWSQCMYMHYILKYLPETMTNKYKLDDMFILALDGDIDFEPEAVIGLVDIMKRDPQIGAACGRIHPVGSGPVVWFQKFEYAIGHWLQKSAEDVLGCVLCSPGCFSLFRGNSLVKCLNKYIRKPTKAAHKIQWDQGEDRWLCTLLIKDGKKIEYSAASDSSTFAPEEFAEFYKQRRRWGPSTLANIFDILKNSRRIRADSESITWLYIIYQAGLLIASLLGSSTVILIVQGALQHVFAMTPIGSLLTAVIPVIAFVIVCYTTKSATQIIVAEILSVAYALVMMAVLAGVIAQITESFLNPTSLFMVGMVSIFAFTGLLHPREASCLIYGPLYYISMPSAMIFLPIYSYCNMNDVSWGTREKNANQEEEEKVTRYRRAYSACCGLSKKIRGTEVTNKSSQTDKSYDNNLKRLVRPQPNVSKNCGIEDVRKFIEEENQEETQKSSALVTKIASEANKTISEEEELFWNVTIEGYLKPDSEEEEKKVKKKFEGELRDLKNKMSGAYLFFNSMWLVLTFSLAQVIDDVGITLTDKNGHVSVLNPISFLFLIFYLLILIIQVITMLIHRWNTFLYVMAKTGFCDVPGSSDKNVQNNSNSDNDTTTKPKDTTSGCEVNLPKLISDSPNDSMA